MLIPRNRICASTEGARWACGQRAFVALRNLLEGKPIACSFKHIADPPKAACSVGDNDVAQFLRAEGWAELAEGVTEEFYVGGLRPPRAEKPAFGRTVRRNDREPPPDGWTEAIMIAHGFSIEQMVERVR